MPLRDRSPMEKLTLVVLLPWVGGSLNGAGVLELGYTTSHMTGTVARFGVELAEGHVRPALTALAILFAFMAGAAISSMLVDGGLLVRRYRYALAFTLETMLLSAFWVVAATPRFREATGLSFLLNLLAFAMGLQNGMVTRMSGAVVRTTHITGIVTDIGLEAVRVSKALLGAGGRKASEVLEGEPEYKRLKLHLAMLLSFTAGACLGPLLFRLIGYVWLLVPLNALVALIVLDVWVGIDDARHALPGLLGKQASSAGPRAN